MDRLISLQEAIDALLKAEKELPYYDGAQVSVNVIKKVPSAQPEPHWIPCSERLPEEEGQYLVTKSRAGKKSVDFAIYFEIYEWNKADPVVAWMPLPKPWKEEGDQP